MARRASRKPFTPPPPSKDQLTTVSPEALQRVLQQAMREVPGTGTAPNPGAAPVDGPGTGRGGEGDGLGAHGEGLGVDGGGSGC